MSTRPILIVWGEPNSIFSEILLKSFRKYKSKKPIILIGSKNLFIKQIKKLNVKFNINLINMIGRDLKDMKINKINFINVEYRFTKPFEKITSKSSILISCHGAISHVATANNIRQIDIIDKSYDYGKWTGHFRNYKPLYRDSFNFLSNKIVELI